MTKSYEEVGDVGGSELRKNGEVVVGLDVPILESSVNKMLYIYQLCPHSQHPKKKNICSNLNSLNTFTKETGSSNVKFHSSNHGKLPKVGSNAIVPAPLPLVRAGPNKKKDGPIS